jgi:hypothetical protein
MEFTVVCPIDGSVEVGLEDIDNVVLRESDRADITFVCPHCGSEIMVTAIVPAFLLAAMEALADDSDAVEVSGLVVVSSEDVAGSEEAEASEPVLVIEDDDPRLEAYCEYFRRQLGKIESVDDALCEIDAKG